MNKNFLYDVRKISNLKEMLEYSCKTYSDSVAFHVKKKGDDKYHPISFKQCKTDVDSLGTSMLCMGLRGQKIAIIGENRYEWAISYLAVVNGVGVIVPIDKELPANEIENLLERSGASAVIYSSKFDETMKKISQSNSRVKFFISMDGDESKDKFLALSQMLSTGEELIEAGNADYINTKIDNEIMSIMLFTSGTTDQAKAVMLSHKNICKNIEDTASVIYFDHNDIFLSFLPLHHTYECTCGFLTPLYKGASIAYCEGLRHIVKNMKESKATVMLSVPLLFESMYNRIWNQAAKVPGKVAKMKVAIKVSNFLRSVFRINITKIIFKELYETLGGSMRIMISGAAAIDPMVAKGFRDFGLHFLQGYGLTECSPIVAVNRDKAFKDASAGLPFPSVQIGIDHPSNDGIGEIVVKGPNVMLGYYKNEEATAKVIKDGWFYTGDLGYIDKKGFLYITGREKNVIVTKNGKNIFPEELETLLNRSPYIKESMVWGKPQDYGDITVCATIVIEKEYIEEKFGEAFTEGQIKDLIDQEVKTVNKNVTLYKHIKDFTIRENELIKTTTKKIKRHLELTHK